MRRCPFCENYSGIQLRRHLIGKHKTEALVKEALDLLAIGNKTEADKIFQNIINLGVLEHNKVCFLSSFISF